MSKADRLTDKIVKSLPVPEKGNRLTYDPDVKGFAVRVTVKGARSYVLNYRTKSGQERRFTIGEAGAWSTSAAREEARALKRQIDQGDDPLETLKAHRTAPTVAELAMRFEAEHLPRCRPLTERDYRRILANDIVPALGRLKVADVAYEHIDGLHRTITRRGSPIVANRAVAITSKMFSMAIRWRWRADNPAKGIARNHENKRQRYLTHGELSRLGNALAGHQDLDAANAVRLLLLTGARRMEVLGCTWEQFDLDAGIWTKPGAATKQKTAHRAPLSSGAVTLLQQLKSQSSEDAIYVFPGRYRGHRVELKRDWSALCAAADIQGVRLHDLRHTYASLLASAGQSLPVIGALLGHTQAQTTQRYAHLFDDPLRQATESVSAILVETPNSLAPART